MKKSSFVIFFSIVFTVYGAVNYYIFITGWNAIPHRSYTATMYIILYLFFSLSFIAGRILERKMLSWFSTFLVWVGSFWLAAMVYFLLFSVFFDLIRLVNLIFPIYSTEPRLKYSELKFLLFFIVLSAVFVIVLLGFFNARIPRVKKLYIKINKPSKFSALKIAAASDIHLGTIVNQPMLRKIVTLINSLEPDLVLLPGDVVDEDIGPVIKQNLGETLKLIKSKYGVYGITGNHEYIGGVEPACKYLEEHGINMLRDRVLQIEDDLFIAGREDRSIKQFAGKLRKPLDEILKDIDKSNPIILMDHQPSGLADAEKNGIDLQLSGHTHNGQLWPFNFITKKVYELSWGFKTKGSTQYYVSCGAGTWGPPIRTGNRPEIVLINAVFENL
jgi:predicted MPP superfamily phosphohydrolase